MIHLETNKIGKIDSKTLQEKIEDKNKILVCTVTMVTVLIDFTGSIFGGFVISILPGV